MLVRRVLVLVRRKFVLGLLCVCLLAMRFSAWGQVALPLWFSGFGFVLLWDSRSGISRPGVPAVWEVSKLLSGVSGPAGHDVGGCVASGCGGRSSRGRTYADRESIAAALFISLSATGVLVLVAFVFLQGWRPLPQTHFVHVRAWRGVVGCTQCG